ncbi:MAG: OmpA family protein [Proteobacteria bacterium]|nr:OmpA family protein [Pseudomonadota bacterium]
MKQRSVWKFLPILTLALVMGCAGGQPITDSNPYTPPSFAKDKYVARNFQVIMDASSSMAGKYEGERKFWLEKRFLSSVGASLAGFNQVGSLRTFGHADSVSLSQTDLRYGPKAFKASDFQAELDRVARPGGTSAMAAALDASRDDLKEIPGQTSLIIVSDGKSIPGDPAGEVVRIKKTHGSRVCVYTVLVGDDEAGGELLQEIADAGDWGACGGMARMDDLESPAALASFVETALLQKDSDGDGVPDDMDICPGTPKGTQADKFGCPGAPGDSDGDGVVDAQDRCPGTPAGTRVDAYGCPADADGDGVLNEADRCPNTPMGIRVDSYGCPIDSDGDGVTDAVDECPGTPKGTRVDGRGCPVITVGDSDGDGVLDSRDQCPGTPTGVKTDSRGCWVLEGIFFDTNKSTIQYQSKNSLDNLVAVLKANPGLAIRVEGHTDNVGSHAYNKKLSEARAKAVVDYLVNAGISANRLSYAGYSFDRPAATNDTAEGRAKNRRVELAPVSP